jgi:hypothetical protein
MMLNLTTSEPEPGACVGAVFSAAGMGERGPWELDWPAAHPGRPLPAVMDGHATVKVQINPN